MYKEINVVLNKLLELRTKRVSGAIAVCSFFEPYIGADGLIT